jgi:flagellar hook-associated protein FlgK
MQREARAIDLLEDFYAAWKSLHELRSKKAEREALETAAQDLAEAHLAYETYLNRHKIVAATKNLKV